MNGKLHNRESFSFDEAELVTAAGMVREEMLKALPEPETCTPEFSEAFLAKMKKLLEREKRRQAFTTVKRWAAAVILLVLVSGGVILAVDTEARAEFFAWVREVYENSIVYRFFNEPEEETLPDYELGWVPEGYELVDLYKDNTTYSAIYQKGDDSKEVFVYEYRYGDATNTLEFLMDITVYECMPIDIGGITAEYYCSLDGSESNVMVWMDEEDGIVFTINAFFDENVMLHIIEDAFLE